MLEEEINVILHLFKSTLAIYALGMISSKRRKIDCFTAIGTTII